MLAAPLVHGAFRGSPRVRYSLDAWLAANNGARWNFARTDTCFQEDVGPTAADDTDELIGLALSQAQWGGKTRAAYLAGQPELVSNPGPFTSTSGYTPINAPANVEAVDGKLAVTINGLDEGVNTVVSGLVAGRSYNLVVSINKGSLSTSRVGVPGNAPIASMYSSSSGDVQLQQFFTAIATTASITIRSVDLSAEYSGTFYINSVSVREVSHYAATQATTARKLKKRPDGAYLDALDDELLTNFIPGSGANLLLAKVKVPTTVSATQVVLGSRSGFDTRSYLSIISSGSMSAGVGTQFGFSAGVDRRGQTVTYAVAYDATTVRFFENDVLISEVARYGVPTTTSPFRIGAMNDNGTPAGHFGGSGGLISQIVVARPAILTDLTTYRQIASAL